MQWLNSESHASIQQICKFTICVSATTVECYIQEGKTQTLTLLLSALHGEMQFAHVYSPFVTVDGVMR